MAGILAVWNDVDPKGYAHYEHWYNREHLHERVGVPGFRFGRRYELVSGGDRRFFTFYEVDGPEVLTSAAYMQRLENPTAWTRDAMASFRGMVRTVCDLRRSEGNLMGGFVTVLRADQAFQPGPSTDAFVTDLARQDGIARVQIWTAAMMQTAADTAEMKMRGQDQLIAGAIIVECVRRADADRVQGVLARGMADTLGLSGATALGIYQLLCMATPA